MDKKDFVLIEDNTNDVELIIDAMKEVDDDLSYEILASGEEAISYAEQLRDNHTKLPRLIILDLKLPRHSGQEFLKIMKQDKEVFQIPVVVFTSSESDKDRELCYSLGANGYVVKPVGFNEFSNSVQTMARYWLFENSPGFKEN